MMNYSAIDITTSNKVSASPAANDHNSSPKDSSESKEKNHKQAKSLTPKVLVNDRRSGQDRRLKNMITSERFDSRNKRDRRAPRLVIKI